MRAKRQPCLSELNITDGSCVETVSQNGITFINLGYIWFNATNQIFWGRRTYTDGIYTGSFGTQNSYVYGSTFVYSSAWTLRWKGKMGLASKFIRHSHVCLEGKMGFTLRAARRGGAGPWGGGWPYYFIVLGSDIGICHGLPQQEPENEDEWEIWHTSSWKDFVAPCQVCCT